MKYEYERQAARGDSMPENLSLSEQKAYQAIRFLYATYRAKRINQTEAAKEKASILRTLKRERDKEALLDKLQDKSVEMFKRLDYAACRYGTERTLENADELIRAIYRVDVGKRR